MYCTLSRDGALQQQNQFTDHPAKDPNEHMGRFLRMANTVKLNGVKPEVIKLHLFPFSLRDIAATWYESLPYDSVNTWEELVEAYLGRFFSPITHNRKMKGDHCVQTGGG